MNQHLFNITLTLAVLGTIEAQPSVDPYADTVVAFDPGVEFATDFSTGLGLTNTVAALGSPSRITEGEFGGPVTPFAPPYLASQLLSIGTGGMVVFEFDPPIFDHPANPYGLDFIIYASSGFSITNGNFSGGGITDGSTFGHNAGQTRVWVSEDNMTYFELDPNVTPTVDSRYPTAGSGIFGIPVDPTLSPSDFAGAHQDRIHELYQQSGGGTGFALEWARDPSGNQVELLEAKYVKIEVIEGRSEIDALSAVLPALVPAMNNWDESFVQNPLENQWQIHGDASLFTWSSDQERLEVTWDSARDNSYFYLPLPRPLTAEEDFSFGFDLLLNEISIGTTDGKPFTFPLAIGAINLAQATRDDYFRGSGIHPVHGPRSVIEWNYLPDSGFGATVSSGLISEHNQWAFQNTFPLELSTDTLYRIELDYAASERVLRSTMTADGEPFGPLAEAKLDDIFGNPLEGGFTFLNADALAIASYSDEGQSPPEFAGSLRANGFVDNLSVHSGTKPSPVRIEADTQSISISIEATPANRYWLEQSTDLVTWITIQQEAPQASGTLTFQLQNNNARGFFRVQQTRP